MPDGRLTVNGDPDGWAVEVVLDATVGGAPEPVAPEITSWGGLAPSREEKLSGALSAGLASILTATATSVWPAAFWACAQEVMSQEYHCGVVPTVVEVPIFGPRAGWLDQVMPVSVHPGVLETWYTDELVAYDAFGTPVLAP
jgi:hypothetical protein